MPAAQTIEASINLSALIQEAVAKEDAFSEYDEVEQLQGGLHHEGCAASAFLTDAIEPEPQHTQSYRNAKRRASRKKRVQENGHAPSKRTKLEHIQLADAVQADVSIANLPAAEGAYGAKNLAESAASREHEYTAEELVAERGFRLVEWDGREAMPITDREGRIFAVLAGRPSDPTYGAACAAAFETISAERDKADFKREECNHRRGQFPALAFGLSQGNGQPSARRLNEGNHASTIRALQGHSSISRIASFGDAAFSTWAPKLYRFYGGYMARVEEKTGETRNFPGSVFACATVNFGPRVRTFKHRDVLNLAFGLCAITALGRFDHKKGGHVILWEAKLVVQFPPGSTILIPSATVTHSNTAIGEHETRASFTQYAGGGVFRWVDNEYQTFEALKKKNRAKYEENIEKNKTRWQEGLKLYSKLSELTADL